jgi:peptidoglycan/xylan/chitin deacetylase (PgdA/CDA1 family)
LSGQSVSVSDECRGRDACLYLLYHELRAAHSKYSYALEATVFEKHADLIAHSHTNQGSILPAEFTFDDGHASDFEFALPILNSRSLRAKFFITVGWIGTKPGYMGWREVRALHDAGHVMGTHGWSHALLTHCTPKELDTELCRSRTLMEDKLGASIKTMSLPGGRYNKRILEACRDAGYTKVYTSEPRSESSSAPGFTVGRLNIRSSMTLDWIGRVLQRDSGELFRLQRQYRMKAGAKAILGDWLYDKLWKSLTRKEPEMQIENDLSK